MRPFNREELKPLLAKHAEPCVTLTMPTHRRQPEASQHPVLYSNLVRQAAAALEKKYGKRDDVVPKLMAQLEQLGGDAWHPEGLRAFWNHQKEGLAVFASPDHFAYFRVPIRLREICVVADSFHVKPLLPLLYGDQRFHVLSLTRNDVTLYEGNADHLEPVALAGVPRSISDALGADVQVERASQAAHGGGTGAGLHHYGRGSDDDKEELRRYFRAVDRPLDEKYSKPSGIPLILAAVDYYHPLYREVSHDKQLLDQGIALDPVGLSREQLHQAALAIVRPIQERRVKEALEEFGAARAWSRGSVDLEEVARSAASGRVKRLLVEDKRRLWGRLDRETGEVSLGGQPGQADDVDVLDDLAEMTLQHGGDVLLVPRDSMPTNHGAAATYRF